MNKFTTYISIVAVVGIVSVGAMVPATTYASPHGNAWGYYGMAPGHMKKEYRYENRWQSERFEDIDAFREYLREYINAWRELHMSRMGSYYSYSYSYDTDILRVTTGTVTDVDEDSATLRGTVDLGDTDEAEVWFEYGEALGDLDEETTRTTVTSDSTHTRTITGLDDATRYYYRIVAEDEDDKVRYGATRSFITDDSENNNDDPTVTTLAARDIEDDRAELRGTVDMEDFDNGIVFFVYGTDRAQVEDVADDFDTYEDIDEDGDDLQKVAVDQDLDDSDSYTELVTSLDDDTLYYYAMGVAYEDEDGDDVIELGSLRSFRTDN